MYLAGQFRHYLTCEATTICYLTKSVQSQRFVILNLKMKIALPLTRVLPIVGLDVGAIGSGSLSAMVRAGRLLFGFLLLSSTKVFQLNFGCKAEVFQIPHHRQYLFVGGYFIGHIKIDKTVIFRLWDITLEF